MSEQYTTDHEEIRAWIEQENGIPVRLTKIPETEYMTPNAIKILFNEESSESEKIEWDEFFDWVETNNLALRFDSKAESKLSMFQFIDREIVPAQFTPEGELPDSGDEETLKENIFPDAET